MDKFTTLTSVAAPLPMDDVDTDAVLPARFLLLLDRTGLGEHLFADLRGPGFVLDQPPYDKAQIIVSGERFGIGSSREQAVWALADFGIRCVIARSFGEIFQPNCVKNGIAPIQLDGDDHATVMAAAQAGTAITVDLEAGTIAWKDADPIAFDIDAGHRTMLLEGRDELDRMRAEDIADIAAFEARQRADKPWLWALDEVVPR